MAKSGAKAGVVSGLDFLNNPADYPAERVCAIYGDETFLKSEVIVSLRRQIFPNGDGDFSLTVFAGRDA
jgi:hypothetical protein